MLVSICSFCQSIRIGEAWFDTREGLNTREILEYLEMIPKGAEFHFSHGFCLHCGKKHYPDFFKE